VQGDVGGHDGDAGAFLVVGGHVASARQATIDALGKVSFEGVTGKVAFDQYGDATTRVLTVDKVVSGAWAPVSTEAFK